MLPRRRTSIPSLPPDFESVTLNNVMVLKLIKDVKMLMASSTGGGGDLQSAVDNLTLAVSALTIEVNTLKDRLKFIYDNSYIIE